MKDCLFDIRDNSRFLERLGGVSEWFKEAVLKTVVSQGTGGSNPSSSAR